MTRSLPFIGLLLCAHLATACCFATPPEAPAKVDKPPQETVEKDPAVKVKLKWRFEEVPPKKGTEDFAAPRHHIFLDVNKGGDKEKIDTGVVSTGCRDKSKDKAKGDVLMVAYCYYAGSGDEVRVRRDGRRLVIEHTPVEEVFPDSPPAPEPKAKGVGEVKLPKNATLKVQAL